jgi:hypothetical protein
LAPGLAAGSAAEAGFGRTATSGTIAMAAL